MPALDLTQTLIASSLVLSVLVKGETWRLRSIWRWSASPIVSLLTPFRNIWSGRADLNRGPPAPKAN